jgi:LPS-assembly protein
MKRYSDHFFSLFLLSNVFFLPFVKADGAVQPVLGWKTRAEILQMPDSSRPKLDKVCPGAWVTPIPMGAKVSDWEAATFQVEADDLHYAQSGNAVLKGKVSIKQDGREISADHAELTQNQAQGSFSGNLFIAEPGLLLTGDQAEFDFATNKAKIRRTEFTSSQINAHGYADEIQRAPSGVMDIKHVQYSTCPPDSRAWSFSANYLHLDPNSGRGVVHSGVLRIKDVPVLYLPYLNFPLDKRRQSGILIPRFGFTNDNSIDISVPVYWNIAPNYDATVTPRIISNRGFMLDNEFRYWNEVIGKGTISAGYLNNDSLYNDRDRKRVSWQHGKDLAPNLTFRSNVNYVSDSAYFLDLNNDLSFNNAFFQERTAEINYTQPSWSLLSRVQSYQVVEAATLDINKPYARLPQILLTQQKNFTKNWQENIRGEWVYFYRGINDNSGGKLNGSRLRFDPELKYIQDKSWGSFTATTKARFLNYRLDTDNGQQNRSFFSPSASLDGKLIFEKNTGSFLQTLEPRLHYLYNKYTEQSALPNFDTTNLTFTYEQLFRGSRFVGGDRLDDTNQISAGITSRLINPVSGNEELRVSLGQAFYLQDRRVNLDTNTAPTTDKTSGLVGQLSRPLGNGWSLNGDAIWDADLRSSSQLSASFNYMPEARDRLFNIAYITRRQDDGLGQDYTRQANVSLVQPVGIAWKLIGQAQYDIVQKETQSALFGLQYESCCWKVRFFNRRFLTSADDNQSAASRSRSVYFLEFELKGLAGVSGGISRFLENNVFGYRQLTESAKSQ